jgi:transcriptional regulator with XRE-family HTH domain
MNIGDFIKTKRDGKRLSVDDLALLSGVSRATIYRIEAGKKSDIDSLEGITTALGYKLSTALRQCGK